MTSVLFYDLKETIGKTDDVDIFYGTPEGTFHFRYLSEKKLKKGNKNGNQNKKYLV